MPSVQQTIVAVVLAAALWAPALAKQQVTDLMLDGGSETTLSWQAVPGALGYDVLQSEAPDFSEAAVLLYVDVEASTVSDAFVPGCGVVRHYLVRSVDSTGPGGWGFQSNGKGRDPAAPARLFSGPTRIDLDTAYAATLVAGQFNTCCDSHVDLAVADYYLSTVTVLLGDGTGGFTLGGSYPVGAQVFALLAGQLDGAGSDDLVALSETFLGGNVGVLLGDGDGGFAAPVFYNGGARLQGAAIADFDGDQFLDIVVSSTENHHPSIGVWVMEGDGEGGFPSIVPGIYSPNRYVITSDSFNACCDELPDVLSTGWYTVGVGLNNGGAGGLRFEELAVVNVGDGLPAAIRTGDFNGDDHRDAVVVNAATTEDRIAVLHGDSTGQFVRSDVPLADGSLAWLGLAVGDFDMDGKDDVSATSWAQAAVAIHPGSAEAALGPANLFGVRGGPSVVADFDDDGAPDLAVLDGGDGTQIAILLNLAIPPADP